MSVNPNGAAPPLAGVRVLAFTQLGAGPYAMTLLADLGADVVKVEDPTTGGDEARRVPPFNEPAAADGLYYQALNRGARSLTLNLRAPEARELLHRLVARADAVYTNLRGDLPAKLGLDYAALRTANPRVVCCTLSGFGRTGPRAGEPGYDFILQAYAGFMSVTGEPDGPPTRSGVSVVDFAGGMLSALADDRAPSRARDGRGVRSRRLALRRRALDAQLPRGVDAQSRLEGRPPSGWRPPEPRPEPALPHP